MTVAILAGGTSSRMGTDKSSIALDGRAMLARVVDAAKAASLPCVVVGRAPEHSIRGVDEWIPDDAPRQGPLAALATALRIVGAEVLLVACDMPMLDAPSLRFLAAIESPADVDIVIVSNAGNLEPLFARYTPSCLAIAEELLNTGERALSSLVDAARVHTVDAPDWLRERLVNINTPDDLARLRSRPFTGLA